MSDLIKVKTETNKLSDFIEGEVDFGKVVQANIAGSEYSFDGAAERVVEQNQTTALPTFTKGKFQLGQTAVHIYKFVPSLGGLQGAGRLQLSVKKLFSDVVGNAYSATEVSEADLIKLQIWSESILILALEIDRALYIYNRIDPINKLTGKCLLQAIGFDFNDIALHKEYYINARNKLANLINDNLYLAHNGRIDKIMYLLGRVFTGDVNRKTDLAVFVPVTYKVADATTFDLDLDWTSWMANDSLSTPKRITLDYINGIIEEMNDLVLSSWFTEVAPYLFHLYGDSNSSLMKLDHYKDISEFAFTYNPYVNEAIRNATVLGTIRGDTDGLLKCRIYEDDDGFIRQGGHNVTSGDKCLHICSDIIDSPTGSGSIYYRTFINTGDLVTNSEDYPSNNDVLQSILALNFVGRAAMQTSSTYADKDQIPLWSGPIYLLGHMVNHFLDEENGYTSVDLNEEITVVPQYVVVNYASTTNRTLSRVNERTSTADNWQNTVYLLASNAGTRFYRSQVALPRKIVTYNSATPGKDFVVDHRDIDNCFMIESKTVINYYYASTFALARVDAPNWKKNKSSK